MAREDLIPLNRRSKEEAKAISRKGGINSGIARKKKKEMREAIAYFLQKEVTQTELDNLKSVVPILDDEDKTMQAMMIAGQVYSAMQGNSQAFKMLVELLENQTAIENQEDDPLTKSLKEIGGKL